MPPKVTSKLGKSKAKTPSEELLGSVKKNPVASIVSVIVLATLLYLFLFVKPKTPEMVQAEENMENIIAKLSERAKETGAKLKNTWDSAKQEAAKKAWKDWTPWQRKSVLQEVKTFLLEKDLSDAMSDILSFPKSLLSSGLPDVHHDQFTEEETRVWLLHDAFMSGRVHDESVLGKANQLMKTVLNTAFWSDLDKHPWDDEDRKLFSSRSWRAVRELMLSRFYFVFSANVDHKVRQMKEGVELEWPEEPKPEPEYKDDPEAQNVLHLTDDTFEESIKKKKNALVMFYAPWCGHCKAFKPHVNKAATALKDQDVVLAAHDCTKEDATCQKFDVKGYPTVIFFQNGEKKEEYTGGRDTYGIVSWLNEIGRMDGTLDSIAEAVKPPPEVTWADEPEAKDVRHMTDSSFVADTSAKGHALVMFYAPWCGHCKSMKPDYAKLATKVKDSDVVIGAIDATVHQKSAAEHDVKGFPTLVYFKGGKKVGEYDSGRTADAILTWLNAKKRMAGALTDIIGASKDAEQKEL